MSQQKIITVTAIFSDRLKSLRNERKKADFARLLGVPPQNYQRYEDGRIPDADMLANIARKCGVTVDWLLGRDPIDLAPVATAAKEARESGGADEEAMIVSEITDRLMMMKSKSRPARDRLKTAIINRVDEYSDYCEEHYRPLREKMTISATQLADRMKDKSSP